MEANNLKKNIRIIFKKNVDWNFKSRNGNL